jgi:hypothetical protein
MQVEAQLGCDATTREVCEQVIKVETAQQRLPYADILDAASAQSHLAAATAYVCHAWDARFADLVDALHEYASASQTPACFWLDIFFVNQHATDQLATPW